MSLLLLYFYPLIVTEASDPFLEVVTEEWPPFNYSDKNGIIVGTSTDKVKKILASAQIDYSINIYPWARAYQIALEKPNVLIYSMMKTPDRTPFFHWFCPLHKNEFYVYKLAQKKDITVTSISDLKKYQMALSRDSFFTHLLEKRGFVEGRNFLLSGSNTVKIKHLLAGRVDVIVDTPEFINKTLQQFNIPLTKVEKTYKITGNEFGQECMALSFKTPTSVVQRVKTAFKSFKQ